MTPRACAALVLISLSSVLQAQGPAELSERVLRLSRIPGVSGHESDVRKAVASMLPAALRAEVDSLGNLVVRFGSGSPRILVVAPLDEPGYVVSAITDEGYLRLHRLAAGSLQPLGHEYQVGQPVLVRTAQARYVAGVTATPSTHLRATRPSGSDNSPRTIDDLFVDVGAASKEEVASRGIRMLDSVSLRERAARLAGSEIAGVAVSARAGATALVEIVNRLGDTRPTGLAGATFIAGLETFDTVFAIDTFVSADTPVDSRRIAYAPLGKGAVLRGLDGRTLVPDAVIDRISSLARDNNIALQIGVTGGGTDASPFSAKGAIDVGLSWPGRDSHSPVEVMDRRDLESLTRLLVVLAQKY